MSNQDNTNALLSALRRHGITIPGEEPIVVRQAVKRSERSYWLVRDGYFECCIDERDAPTAEIALDVAHSPIECWYFIGHRGEGIGRVTRITRNEYVDWLRSHQ